MSYLAQGPIDPKKWARISWAECMSYTVLRIIRTIRWTIPAILGCMLYWGPLYEEFVSQTISFRVVEEDNRITQVIPNTEKEFTYIDYDTYSVYTIMLSPNTTNISSKTLDQLLLRWLVNPDGMNESSSSSNCSDPDAIIQDKINLLLKISSPDFWAKNYWILPKQSRVSWYMWGHGRYLYYVRTLQTISNRDSLIKAFNKISNKLKKHSYYEEVMLYPFIQDNYRVFQLSGTAQELKMALESMTLQHIPIHNQEDHIVNEFMDKKNGVKHLKKLMLTWQRSLEKHFLQEEQTMVHILLKFDNPTYRRYLYYLSWGYLFHAIESFIDYVLNLFYIIN